MRECGVGELFYFSQQYNLYLLIICNYYQFAIINLHPQTQFMKVYCNFRNHLK